MDLEFFHLLSQTPKQNAQKRAKPEVQAEHPEEAKCFNTKMGISEILKPEAEDLT